MPRLSKAIRRDQFNGTYIGITTFSTEIQSKFFHSMQRLISAGRVNEFFNVAVQDLADKGVVLGSTSTAGLPWAEIDDAADLTYAREHVFPRLQYATAA